MHGGGDDKAVVAVTTRRRCGGGGEEGVAVATMTDAEGGPDQETDSNAALIPN